MLEKGYYVLRYNTRGAGRSSGWPSLTGFREAKDLQELVQWALATIPSITSVVIMVCSRTHCPPTIDLIGLNAGIFIWLTYSITVSAVP